MKRVCRQFTEKDDKTIRAMRLAGEPIYQIAKATGRAESSIRNRVELLEGRKQRKPRDPERQRQLALKVLSGWPTVPGCPVTRERLYLEALHRGMKAEGLAA